MYVQYTLIVMAQLVKVLPCPPKPPGGNGWSLVSNNGLVLSLLILAFTALILGIGAFVFFMKTGRLQVISASRRPSYPMENIFVYGSPEGRRPLDRELLPPPVQQPQDPLQNKQWLALARECVNLFEELDRIGPNIDSARREMAQHVQSRLEEILARSGVEVIQHDQIFDPLRHRLVSPGYTDISKAPIIETVSPGFAVNRLVLRPAQVRVAFISKDE